MTLMQKQFKLDQPWDKTQSNINFYKNTFVQICTHHFTKKEIGNVADHSESTILMHWPQCNNRYSTGYDLFCETLYKCFWLRSLHHIA